MITRQVFQNLVNYLLHKNRDWRYGQAVFNAAAIIAPEYCFPGEKSDPFYNDNNVAAFIEMLADKGVIV